MAMEKTAVQASCTRITNTPAALANKTLMPSKMVQIFLLKLYHMVSNEDSNLYISWTPSGQSFIIPRPKDFSEIILPKFFKHNKFTSFVRQLNMYGFYKIPNITSSGHSCSLLDDPWEFANPQFIRDQPNLLCAIVRKRNSSSYHGTESPPSASPYKDSSASDGHSSSASSSVVDLDLDHAHSTTANTTTTYSSSSASASASSGCPSGYISNSSAGYMPSVKKLSKRPRNECLPHEFPNQSPAAPANGLSCSSSMQESTVAVKSSLGMYHLAATDNSHTLSSVSSELDALKKYLDVLSSQQCFVSEQLQSVMGEFFAVKSLLQRHQTDIDIIMSFLASLLMMTKGISSSNTSTTQTTAGALDDHSNNPGRKLRRLADTSPWGHNPASSPSVASSTVSNSPASSLSSSLSSNSALSDTRYAVAPGMPEIPQALLDYLASRGAGGDMQRLYESFVQSSLDRISTAATKNNHIQNELSKINDNVAYIENETSAIHWPTPPTMPEVDILGNLDAWSGVHDNFGTRFIGNHDSMPPFDLSGAGSNFPQIITPTTPIVTNINTNTNTNTNVNAPITATTTAIANNKNNSSIDIFNSGECAANGSSSMHTNNILYNTISNEKIDINSPLTNSCELDMSNMGFSLIGGVTFDTVVPPPLGLPAPPCQLTPYIVPPAAIGIPLQSTQSLYQNYPLAHFRVPSIIPEKNAEPTTKTKQE